MSIKLILSGIQETNYPISNKEQDDIKQEYMKLLWDKEYKLDIISSCLKF